MTRSLLSRLRVGAICFGTVVLFSTAANSWALGLGEIELNSALNEKLDANIELIDASGLQPDEILVSLASREAFEQIGVERFFFLTDLELEVVVGRNGGAAIAISSSRPITEPYLNFLVEILWSNGRLVKEYTILLDPPTFSAAAAPAVSAPSQAAGESGGAGRVQRSVTQSGTRVQIAPRGTPSAFDQNRDGMTKMTNRNDTLWSIAARSLPSRQVSVQQNMLAIQRLNPEAFISGNINLLKAGYALQLPNEAQALSLPGNEALVAVARHNEQWQAIRRGERVQSQATAVAERAAAAPSELRSPIDATPEPAQAVPQTVSEGELRIVAEAGDSATGRLSEAAAQELTTTLEENDRLSREVDELTYQLDREQDIAGNQIAVKDRQLEVKDQQIAQLQAQLQQAELLAQQQAAQEPQQNQNQSASSPTQAPWWQSPYVLFGGVGALVLLLVGGMLAMRRKRQTADDFYDEEVESSAAEAAELVDDDEFEDDVDGDTFAGDDEDTVTSADDDSDDADFEEELQGSQTNDVIGEADIYIAYGRYPQATGLLLGVLEDEPLRNDVRLKLLELYAETGDREAFDEHMVGLIENCDDDEPLLAAKELESNFGDGVVSLDEMTVGEADSQAGEDPGSENEFDSLLEGVFDEDDAEPVADPAAGDSSEVAATAADTTETATAEADESTGLDFELELDDAEDTEARDEPAADLEFTSDTDDQDTTEDSADNGAGDELGGDLGLDFNPDEADSTADATTAEADSADASAGASSDAGAAQSAEDELETAANSDADEFNLDELFDDDATGSSATSVEADAMADLDEDVATVEDDEFDFQDEGDSANTKLDLARAYIDMGDADGARDILKEVLEEGNADQQQLAESMLETL